MRAAEVLPGDSGGLARGRARRGLTLRSGCPLAAPGLGGMASPIKAGSLRLTALPAALGCAVRRRCRRTTGIGREGCGTGVSASLTAGRLSRGQDMDAARSEAHPEPVAKPAGPYGNLWGDDSAPVQGTAVIEIRRAQSRDELAAALALRHACSASSRACRSATSSTAATTRGSISSRCRTGSCSPPAGSCWSAAPRSSAGWRFA